MSDRLINSTWWLVVLGLICTTGSAALVFVYKGLFDVLAGRYSGGVTCLAWSIACGIGAWALCRHRNELI